VHAAENALEPDITRPASPVILSQKGPFGRTLQDSAADGSKGDAVSQTYQGLLLSRR